ncbi:TAXI family TRAP transporter solute-binding subunit [Arthrobacter sp. H14-L1]|uniref:TAXI family TRAP transporter solute-binding subunit n=1 Tax=Arthrobacter sp. H14-L1 TaxID=2996697 RepID=UPI002271A07B|nr:TAXI family TRAP transporter solute-binding subunit [Arthrobacter sp. H14-L1]MCY0904503.1 ABC transporter substrate-binding protein [Arthrobacter sp. H14-L1]
MTDLTAPRTPFPRRTALKAAWAAGLGGVLLPVLAGCTSADRPAAVTVAGGEEGGFYLEFSTLLAQALQRHGVAKKASSLKTGGSLDNLEYLLAGRATFAVALADAAAQRLAATKTSTIDIAALGRVYENYVHCVVRRTSGIRDITELAGRKAAIGELGSGTSLTTARLIEASGLSASSVGTFTDTTSTDTSDTQKVDTEKTISVMNLGLNDGLAALRSGSVDALFWSGGVPTAAIAATNEEIGLGFVDLSSLIPVMRTRHGAFYDRVLIPEGSYEGAPAVWTVGVANLLLCQNGLDNGTVTRTVDLLVDHAQELIPRSSLGVQFLSPESLINTAGLPLHAAARTAYRALHG